MRTLSFLILQLRTGKYKRVMPASWQIIHTGECALDLTAPSFPWKLPPTLQAPLREITFTPCLKPGHSTTMADPAVVEMLKEQYGDED